MKRTFILLLSVLLFVSMFPSCSEKKVEKYIAYINPSEVSSSYSLTYNSTGTFDKFNANVLPAQTKTIELFGKTYETELFKESDGRWYNMDYYHLYHTTGGYPFDIFWVNDRTGKISKVGLMKDSMPDGYKAYCSSVADNCISEDRALEIAREYAAKLVDMKDYELKSTFFDKTSYIYSFEFGRKYNGIYLADTVSVKILCDGTFYNYEYWTDIDPTEIKDFDVERYNAAKEAKLKEIEEQNKISITDLNYEDELIVQDKYGNFAVVSQIEISFTAENSDTVSKSAIRLIVYI